MTIPVSYEDMMNVDAWDDSMLVFKKVNMQGFDLFQQSLLNSAAAGNAAVITDHDAMGGGGATSGGVMVTSKKQA